MKMKRITLPNAETMMARLTEGYDSPFDRELYKLIVKAADCVYTPSEVARMIMAAILIHIHRQGSTPAVHAAYLVNIEWFIDAVVPSPVEAHMTKECCAKLRGQSAILAHLKKTRPGMLSVVDIGKKRSA